MLSNNMPYRPIVPLVLALLSAVTLLAQESEGRRIFEAQCALCHGQQGGGGRGPSLVKPTLTKAPDAPSLEKLISEGIPPEMPGAWQLSPNEVKRLAVFVRSLGQLPSETVPGDPAHGRDLYRRQACASCHIVAGQGSGFGPELSAIGARRNAAFLREALLSPSAALPEGFLMVEAVPRQGAKVTGIRVGEDPFTIQIIDAAGGFHSFRLADLQPLNKLPKRSPMPAYAKLPPADITDLVAYLASLKGTR